MNYKYDLMDINYEWWKNYELWTYGNKQWLRVNHTSKWTGVELIAGKAFMLEIMYANVGYKPVSVSLVRAYYGALLATMLCMSHNLVRLRWQRWSGWDQTSCAYMVVYVDY